MNNKQMLEECEVLSISDIKSGINCIKRGHLQGLGTIEGLVYIINRKNDDLWFEIELLSQKILLSPLDIRFGTRLYLTCGCGKHANKLYLPMDGNKYVCRECVDLPYELSGINRHSKHGEVLYRMSRMIKLSKNRQNIKRIFHNGQFTKRFKSYLGMCERAGFVNEVAEANKLLVAVNC